MTGGELYMKQRFLIRPLTTLVLAGAMILMMGLFGIAYADSGVDGNIQWNYDNSTKVLTVGLVSTSVDDSQKRINYTVTEAPWYPYRYELQKVVISDGVTVIGGGSFYWYDELKEVKLPASVVKITDIAFNWDGNLESVFHPNGNCFIEKTTEDEDYEYGSYDDPFNGCNDSILTFDIPGDPEGLSDMANYCIWNGYRIKGHRGSLNGAYIKEKYEGDPPLEEEPDRGIWFFTKVKWTGKALKPVPEVQLYGHKLIYGEDFICTYSKNKNVGEAFVEIEGIGDYCDSTASYFIIYPKGTSITGLQAGKGKLTVKWQKQDKKMSTSRITGYQVQVATNKSFTQNKKKKTVKGYKNISKTITGLKSKKTYYVRVRTYKDAGLPVNIYSTWSPVKKVKVK